MRTVDLFESITPQIGLDVFNQLMQCVEQNQPCDLLIGTETRPVTVQEARLILGNYRKIAKEDKAAGLDFLGNVSKIEACLESIDSKVDEDRELFANADKYAEQANYQVRETDRTNMPIGSPKNFGSHEEAVAYGKEQKAANPEHKFAIYRVAFNVAGGGVPDYNSTNEDRLNTEIYSVAIKNIKTGGKRNVEIRVETGTPEAKAMEYLQPNETITGITPKEGVLDNVDEAVETELDLSKGVIPSEPVEEGFQDFNKVEPYEVCLAGKPVKTFDYYEDARKFHDNWKKKLYREGNPDKADKITLNPIMNEHGGGISGLKHWQAAMEESVGVTDFNPPSQGGTRKELLAKYAKTGSAKDAAACVRAGASQMELKAAWPGKSISEDGDASKVDTATLQKIHALHKTNGERGDTRSAQSAARIAAELEKRGIRVAEGAVDNLEARRIDDLNMKMLELLDRAKTARGPVRDALKSEFQKVKAARDSYFKINPATGMDPTGLIGTTKGALDEVASGGAGMQRVFHNGQWVDPKTIKTTNEGVYQAQYKSKEEAIAYAKERVKEIRDPDDGIEIWQLPTGFDVVHTMNANGRNHVVDNGGKKLGTVYKTGSNVKEGRDGVYHESNPKIDLYNRETKEYLGSTNWYQTVFTAVQSYVQKHPELEGKVIGKKDIKEADQKKSSEIAPRNFVVKNMKQSGQGKHKDLKRAQKQGDFKHKSQAVPMDEGNPNLDPWYAYNTENANEYKKFKSWAGAKKFEQNNLGWKAVSAGHFHDKVKSQVNEANRDDESIIRSVMDHVFVDGGGGNLSYMIELNAPTMDKLREKYHDDLDALLSQTSPKELSQAANELRGMFNRISESTDIQLDENLHKWFKEKWVRFNPQGKIMGPCARGKDSEGKPKCLPQSKAHTLGKKGRASAAAKKRREDPNPERKGAAKNVATKVKEEQLDEKQDACYRKVKSRYKVWPSAYASGALVKCRKVGAANWGNKTKKEDVEEEWSQKYKDSVNCSDPKGFSQKAHCAGKKKNEDVVEGTEDGLASTVFRRILAKHRDVLSRHSADAVLDAAREEATFADSDDIDALTAKTINTLDHEMHSHREFAEEHDSADTYSKVEDKAWHTNYYGGLDEESNPDTDKDELKPGEYYVWTVHFDDGTQSKVKVTTEDFDAKAFYAKKGKNVIKVDYDWTPHK